MKIYQSALRISLLLFLVLSSTTHTAFAKYNNAFWVQGNYIREHYWTNLPIRIKVTDEDQARFIKIIEEQKIKYVYLFWSAFNKDGKLQHVSPESYEYKKFKELQSILPDVHFIPWLGGVQNRSIYLHDKKWNKNAKEQTLKLMKLLGTKTKYVHINFEYLLYGQIPEKQYDYGENFIKFFKELRHDLDKKIKISTVVASTTTKATPFKYRHSVAEINRVLPYIDQINFLFYDTKISNQEKYYAALREQLSHISAFSKKKSDVEYIIGTGTFENHWPPARKYRDLKIESLPHFFGELKKELKEKKTPIEGVAYFCEWLTDDHQWEEIKKLWVNTY